MFSVHGTLRLSRLRLRLISFISGHKVFLDEVQLQKILGAYGSPYMSYS